MLHGPRHKIALDRDILQIERDVLVLKVSNLEAFLLQPDTINIRTIFTDHFEVLTAIITVTFFRSNNPQTKFLNIYLVIRPLRSSESVYIFISQIKEYRPFQYSIYQIAGYSLLRYIVPTSIDNLTPGASLSHKRQISSYTYKSINFFLTPMPEPVRLKKMKSKIVATTNISQQLSPANFKVSDIEKVLRASCPPDLITVGNGYTLLNSFEAQHKALGVDTEYLKKRIETLSKRKNLLAKISIAIGRLVPRDKSKDNAVMESLPLRIFAEKYVLELKEKDEAKGNTFLTDDETDLAIDIVELAFTHAYLATMTNTEDHTGPSSNFKYELSTGKDNQSTTKISGSVPETNIKRSFGAASETTFNVEANILAAAEAGTVTTGSFSLIQKETDQFGTITKTTEVMEFSNGSSTNSNATYSTKTIRTSAPKNPTITTNNNNNNNKKASVNVTKTTSDDIFDKGECLFCEYYKVFGKEPVALMKKYEKRLKELDDLSYVSGASSPTVDVNNNTKKKDKKNKKKKKIRKNKKKKLSSD